MRGEIGSDVAGMVALAKAANPTLPCAVGFGISTPEQAAAMADVADGVIVGSAIVEFFARHSRDVVPPLRDYVAQMKAALS